MEGSSEVPLPTDEEREICKTLGGSNNNSMGPIAVLGPSHTFANWLNSYSQSPLLELLNT